MQWVWRGRKPHRQWQSERDERGRPLLTREAFIQPGETFTPTDEVIVAFWDLIEPYGAGSKTEAEGIFSTELAERICERWGSSAISDKFGITSVIIPAGEERRGPGRPRREIGTISQ